MKVQKEIDCKGLFRISSYQSDKRKDFSFTMKFKDPLNYYSGINIKTDTTYPLCFDDFSKLALL